MSGAISTAVFDLESGGLYSDEYGVVLCGVIKSSKRKKPYVFRIDELDRDTWKRGKRGHDRNTVRAIAEVLEDHDVLVAHNGMWFDLPLLRTRQLRWGDRRLPDMKVIDPFQIARRKFKLKSNSLGRIANYVGVKDRKTPLDMSTWSDALLNGDKPSLDLIVEHCVADVNVLDGVLAAVKPYVRQLDDRGSAL